jgi:AcrR family transcriptional regulator
VPYPAQVNPERILEKARELAEAEGAGQLSLHQLGAALGVKAPSLYRYFPSKTGLLRALNTLTTQNITAAMQEAAAPGGGARQRLLRMAGAWRAFSRAYPVTYALAFTNTHPDLRPDERLLEALAIPIQQVMASISGEENSLAALRGLWALIHGFVMLELSGQFRRGGDLEEAYMRSVEAYLDGWEQKGRA